MEKKKKNNQLFPCKYKCINDVCVDLSNIVKYTGAFIFS